MGRYFKSGAWQDPLLGSDSFSYPDVSTHTVAAKTRHLAVVAVVTNHSTNVFLLYEPASSGINLLKCSYNHATFHWQWSNFSSSLIHKAHGLGLELSAPFTVESRNGNETDNFEMLLAAKKDGAYLSDLVTAYPDGNSTGQQLMVICGFSSYFANKYRGNACFRPVNPLHNSIHRLSRIDSHKP